MKYSFSIATQEELNEIGETQAFPVIACISIFIDKRDIDAYKGAEENFQAGCQIKWFDYYNDIKYKIVLFEESMWAFELFLPVIRWLKDHTSDELVDYLKLEGYEEIK